MKNINLVIEDLIDKNEVEFLLSKKFTEEFPNLMEIINEPKYTIGDLKISPRDATYWDKQGILPENINSGTRRKYNLINSIWIKLIQQMRSLGIGLNTIKKLKDNLLKPNINVKEIFNSKNAKDYLDFFIKKFNLKIDLETFLNDPDFVRKFNNNSNLLEQVIISVIVYRVPLILMVNKNGEYIILNYYKYSSYLDNKDFKNFIINPFFSLSISDAYASLVKEWYLTDLPETEKHITPFISKSEIEILNYLRKNNVKSITVKCNKGEPYLLEVNEIYEISLEQRFIDVIAKNAYQKISIYTRNGKIVHFENIFQKKLKKETI